MKLIEILSINLKYYRMHYNLSQEKFAEVLGTSLSYLNQIENLKVNVRLQTVDKFADNLRKYDPKSKIAATDFLIYKKEHITSYSRVDEKKVD
jgi:transcriptional regulator with XRE-family HTH domain